MVKKTANVILCWTRSTGSWVLLFLGFFVFLSACTTFSDADGLAREYYNIAQQFEAQKDLGKAADYYQKALAIRPSMRMARFNIARIKLSKGEFDQAQSLYQSLSREDPENTVIQEALAYLDAKRGIYQKAWDSYQSIQKKTQGRISVLYNMLLLAGELGNWKDGLAVATGLLAINPSELAYLKMAIVVAAHNADSNGVAQFEDFISQFVLLSEKDDKVTMELFQQLKKFDDKKWALILLEKTVAHNEKNAQANFELARLRLAKSEADSLSCLNASLANGFNDEVRIKDFVREIPQASRQPFIDAVKKKIAGFSLEAPQSVDKKKPETVTPVPGNSDHK